MSARRSAPKWPLLAVCLLLISSCSLIQSDDPVAQPTPDPEAVEAAARSATTTPRRYRAEWFIDAGAAGRTEPGIPYAYIEVIDDREGRYYLQSPKHLAVQTRDAVIICADIWTTAGEPSCAQKPRPAGVPDVASIALGKLRDWSPKGVFEVAGEITIEVVANASPDVWQSERDVHREVPVSCWGVIAPTSAAPPGFRICYTADDNELVASIDLNGDGLLEADLTRYEPSIDDDRFELPYEIIQDERVFELLVFIFPEIPAGEDESDAPENEGDGRG